MKIVISTGIYPPDIGGPATYSKLLFDELPKRGIDVSVLSFGEVRHLPKIISHFVFLIKLLKKSIKADIIFAQDTVSVGLPSLLASKILRKKLFVRVPGDYVWERVREKIDLDIGLDDFQSKVMDYGYKIRLIHKIQNTVINSAVSVIVPSNYFSNTVRKWMRYPERLHVINNGVDLTEINSFSRNIEKEKVIISAGRLIKGKGFEGLINMLSNMPDWKLMIVGDGPEMTVYKDIIKDKGLHDRVFLTGSLSRKMLFDKINTSMVFVLNTAFETFSFQTIEAMAFGLPVIVTRVGALPDIVSDGVEGFLVEYNDIESMSKYIKMIEADPILRKSLSEKAVEKVRNNFSIDRSIDSLIEIFKISS